MVGFFVFVVLSRSRLEPGRAGAVRRDWVTAVAAYLLVVVPVVHAGSLLL